MNFIKFVNTPELNTVKLLNVASGKTDTGAKNTSDSPQTPLGETETTIESQKKVDIRITKSKADSIAIGADVTADNNPKAHKESHASGRPDAINVAGLSGLLADDQHVLDSEVSTVISNDVNKTFVDALDIVAKTVAEIDTHKAKELYDIISEGADIELAVKNKHAESHNVVSHSDTTVTGAQLNSDHSKLDLISAGADVTADNIPADYHKIFTGTTAPTTTDNPSVGDLWITGRVMKVCTSVTGTPVWECIDAGI